MRSAEGGLPLRHAIALGLLQGPAELLPISSSAHTTLVPWLARWPYARLDGERRKSFEVALHAGAGLALALHMRRQLVEDARRVDRSRAVAVALSLAPPAIAGYALERPIERRLGGPRSIAVGLLAGALSMALADGWAARRSGAGREQEDLRAGDGLAIGVTQAAALIPGVSRNGAALTAARARGFDRRAAQALSWHAGLPVLFGASALKSVRLRRRAPARGERPALVLGAIGAFLSTLASARLMRRVLRDGYPLLPCSLYRCALAALVLARLRDDATRTPARP
jgi:undecaprenyl-diphosphatase